VRIESKSRALILAILSDDEPREDPQGVECRGVLGAHTDRQSDRPVLRCQAASLQEVTSAAIARKIACSMSRRAGPFTGRMYG
jgi:hypothetical protein